MIGSLTTYGYGTSVKEEFPNLDGLTRGMVSGQLADWPMLIVEADKALKLIDELQEAVAQERYFRQEDFDRAEAIGKRMAGAKLHCERLGRSCGLTQTEPPKRCYEDRFSIRR